MFKYIRRETDICGCFCEWQVKPITYDRSLRDQSTRSYPVTPRHAGVGCRNWILRVLAARNPRLDEHTARTSLAERIREVARTSTDIENQIVLQVLMTLDLLH